MHDFLWSEIWFAFKLLKLCLLFEFPKQQHQKINKVIGCLGYKFLIVLVVVELLSDTFWSLMKSIKLTLYCQLQCLHISEYEISFLDFRSMDVYMEKMLIYAGVYIQHMHSMHKKLKTVWIYFISNSESIWHILSYRRIPRKKLTNFHMQRY